MAIQPCPTTSNAAPPAEASDPFAFHQRFTAARTPEEKRQIARVKRFVEWIMADRQFRLDLLGQPDRARELAAARGLEADPHQLEPLWRDGFSTIIPPADPVRWPLMGLWNAWVRDILRYRDLLFLSGDPGASRPAFSAWRLRRAAANDFVLGARNKAIVYAVFAYELSQGCSQGCWFCAFAAPRLRAVFRYDRANARLWREILETGRDLLGQGAAQSGFCYWATEPSDNPDYLRFLEDYRRINGALCQTTTAAATRDLAWTRAMLALYEDEPRSVRPRFSVLSLKTLAEIHRCFSPDELLRVECIPQNPESILYKAKTGRAAGECSQRWRREYLERAGEQQPAAAETQDGQSAEPLTPDFGGTTACLAGYLVNLVERSVKLVSPCPASPRRPLGYRVHAEGHFETAADYRRFIETTIAEFMPAAPPADRIAALAEGVSWSEDSRGWLLRSALKGLRPPAGDAVYAGAAQMASEAAWTPAQIMARLMDQGSSPLDAAAALQDLFDRGLLE